MDIDLARTFLAIVETGNFNKAADRINVTQSTVSMRIKSLEDSLGQPLFHRSKAGASLTAAGAMFLKHAQTLVRTWEQARHEVALPENFGGMLTVGGQFTLWDNLLLRWIPWMRAAVPDLAIRAEVGLSEGLMHQLLDGMLDIAVMYTPQSRPGFTIEELMAEQLVLVSTSPDTRGPGEDGYVYVEWGPEFRINYVNAYPDLEHAAVSVSHGPMGLQYILESGGSGYFPLRTVRGHLDAKELFRVSGSQTFSRPAFMVYPADREDDERFKTALQGLRYVASVEAARH